MFGAIIGDIAGSYYEINNIKTKKFKLMEKYKSKFTDDTITTLVVAKSILECNNNYDVLKEILINNMVSIGRKYSQCGFGGSFFKWIISDNHEPYNSYGNGAAMRVSACGLVAKNMEEVKKLSKIVTEISHNHPEAMKAAEAISVSIFMAKSGCKMNDIKSYILKNYYDIKFTLNEIRPMYDFNITCQGSVPQALEAFFESKSFEDAIRNAISIGGDSDTIAAITGSIAAAYYGVPNKLKRKALSFFDENLDNELIEIINDFERKYPTKCENEFNKNNIFNYRYFMYLVIKFKEKYQREMSKIELVKDFSFLFSK